MSRLVARIVGQVGSDRFERYFGKQAAIGFDEQGIVVTVTSSFVADIIRRRFGECLREVARAETDRPTADVRFAVDAGRFGRDDADASVRKPHADRGRGEGPSRRKTLAPAPSRGSVTRSSTGRRPIGPRLDTFIVGQTNRLAHSSAIQFAEASASFRTLFVHGRCGVGKTHMLGGVAARFREKHPNATVRSTTAEAFKAAFVAAVRGNDIERFRKSYRGVDLLCIDDVHLLAGREGTQNALLHTFDALELGGARIALASDAHPRQIRELSGALVSRFLSGMVARIDAPDAELCERLAQTLATRRGLVLEPDAARVLAAHTVASGGSVRELEGMLTRVEAVRQLLSEGPIGRTVGGDVVRRAIGLGLPAAAANSRPKGSVHVQEIIAAVCTALGVEPASLHDKGRHKRVVLARGLVSYLAKQHTTLSYPEIGRALSRPNHSSVITAHNRVAGQIERSEALSYLGDGPPIPWPDVRSLSEHLSAQLGRPSVR